MRCAVRAVSDFEYELQYAMLNQKLDKGLEAIYLMTASEYSFLSSSMGANRLWAANHRHGAGKIRPYVSARLAVAFTRNSFDYRRLFLAKPQLVSVLPIFCKFFKERYICP